MWIELWISWLRGSFLRVSLPLFLFLLPRIWTILPFQRKNSSGTELLLLELILAIERGAGAEQQEWIPERVVNWKGNGNTGQLYDCFWGFISWYFRVQLSDVTVRRSTPTDSTGHLGSGSRCVSAGTRSRDQTPCEYSWVEVPKASDI